MKTPRRIPRDRLGRPLPAGGEDELTSRGDPEAPGLSSSAALDQAARLFGEQRFFEAHEWLEHIWKSPATSEEDRDFWQGLTQVAVGFCHCQRGNAEGAAALLARAARQLSAYPSPHHGIDTATLIEAASRVREALLRGYPPADLTFPPFPRTR